MNHVDGEDEVEARWGNSESLGAANREGHAGRALTRDCQHRLVRLDAPATATRLLDESEDVVRGSGADFDDVTPGPTAAPVIRLRTTPGWIWR